MEARPSPTRHQVELSMCTQENQAWSMWGGGTHCEGGVSMGGKAEMEELPPKSTKGCSVGIWSMQPFTSIFVYFLQLDYHFQFHNKLVWLF